MIDIIEKHIADEIGRLEDENNSLRKWIRPNKEVPRCVVCGRPIKGISIQRMLRPYRWCSRKCFEYKPRKIVKLEEEYGLDIVDILKETTRRYGRIKSQCQALGISIPYLYAIIAKYCGYYLPFFAQYATGQRKIDYVRKLREERKAKDQSIRSDDPSGSVEGLQPALCSEYN